MLGVHLNSLRIPQLNFPVSKHFCISDDIGLSTKCNNGSPYDRERVGLLNIPDFEVTGNRLELTLPQFRVPPNWVVVKP